MASIFDSFIPGFGEKIGQAFGLLGDDLRAQVTDETDELKKRRQQQQGMLGAVSSSLGSRRGFGSVTQTLGGWGGQGGLRGY